MTIPHFISYVLLIHTYVIFNVRCQLENLFSLKCIFQSQYGSTNCLGLSPNQLLPNTNSTVQYQIIIIISFLIQVYHKLIRFRHCFFNTITMLRKHTQLNKWWLWLRIFSIKIISLRHNDGILISPFFSLLAVPHLKIKQKITRFH